MDPIRLLTSIGERAVPVFVVTSMLAMGMQLTVPQIVGPLKNGRLVALALLANFVLAPLLAFAITRSMPLDPSVQIALTIEATAAGAPFLPKLTQVAKGSIAFAVGLMVLLMVVTVGYMPVVLPLLLPGVAVDPWAIGRSLFTLLLVPLAVGLLVNARAPRAAGRLKGVLNAISNVAIAVLLIVGIGVNVPNIMGLIRSGDIFAYLLFIGGCLAMGWLLGGRDPRVRSAMTLGTTQRNGSASVVVAAHNFAGTNAFPFVLVMGVLLLVILMPVAKWMGGRGAAGEVVVTDGE